MMEDVFFSLFAIAAKTWDAKILENAVLAMFRLVLKFGGEQRGQPQKQQKINNYQILHASFKLNATSEEKRPIAKNNLVLLVLKT